MHHNLPLMLLNGSLPTALPKGWTIPLGVGCYDSATLDAWVPGGTNQISWITFQAGGYQVFLFDEDNFQGNYVAITSDQVLCYGPAGGYW